MCPLKVCNFGGLHVYPQVPGPAVYIERCIAPATHRYQAAEMVEGYWGHRCAQHVRQLDVAYCAIEPLAPDTSGRDV